MRASESELIEDPDTTERSGRVVVSRGDVMMLLKPLMAVDEKGAERCLKRVLVPFAPEKACRWVSTLMEKILSVSVEVKRPCFVALFAEPDRAREFDDVARSPKSSLRRGPSARGPPCRDRDAPFPETPWMQGIFLSQPHPNIP
jgi:hypothetical protein